MRPRLLRLKPAPLVAALRWVMVGAIFFSVVLTLVCQPENFWRDPVNAMRGDGESIHDATNHTFQFFLGRGALPYVVANLVYAALAFAVVSWLPRTLALIAIFSVIFAHGYGATNWFGTHFHLGVGLSPAIYGTLLGTALSFPILRKSAEPRATVNAWRWLMVATLFVDFTNTLIGQPAGYWHDPAAMHEGNILVREFLGHGWFSYLLLDLAIAAGEFALVTFLPLPVAFVCVFAFMFGSFSGATNWFFFTWRMGWVVPVAYGVLLSTLLVAFALRRGGLEEREI